MIAAESSIPEMVAYLWPPTAALLDKESPELQILALSGLRQWLCIIEVDPTYRVMLNDPFLHGQCVDEFIKSFVETYKERPDV